MAILHHLTIYTYMIIYMYIYIIIYIYIHSYIIYVYIQLNIIILIISYHVWINRGFSHREFGDRNAERFDAQLAKSNGTWEQLELL